MSQYTNDELGILRRCVQEICDERFFSTQHEHKKKLTTFSTKESDLTVKLTKCLQDLKQIRENHCARPFTYEYRHATTQTDAIESQQVDDPSSDSSSEEPVSKTKTSCNESTKSVTLSLPENFKPTITTTGSPSAQKTASTSTSNTASTDVEMTDVDARPPIIVKPKLELQTTPRDKSNKGSNQQSSQPPLICIDDSD